MEPLYLSIAPSLSSSSPSLSLSLPLPRCGMCSVYYLDVPLPRRRQKKAVAAEAQEAHVELVERLSEKKEPQKRTFCLSLSLLNENTGF